MATIPADPPSSVDDAHHGHDDHDHPSFLAHHFDTPEQQFDSGKLGMWLFLVTEVLFFSGMFCAYAIFRALRPEVFEGNSQFLNTKLGAINTGVLLFSSLTAAWAVRCSQTGEHKKLVGMLAATISCAMIFLGVKAIEYTHKWAMGLFPAGLYSYDPALPHGPAEHPPYLLYVCIPFIILLAICVVWLVKSFLTGDKFGFECAKPLTVAAACFFVGVGLGLFLESGESAEHDGEHVEHVAGHVNDKPVGAEMASGPLTELAIDPELTLQERLATDKTNSGIAGEIKARFAQDRLARGEVMNDPSAIAGGITQVSESVFTPYTAGVFFSIYYCMTGVHAIHILGGIGVLTWLLIRAVREDFNPQYFGPVDYVGLYWHLVDLIWIYLFPLLYLIR